MVDKICDVCGINMTDDDGISYIGFELNIKLPKGSGKVHHEVCRVLDTFGKTHFRICYVCWLKSLGIKEKGVK